MFTSIFSTSLSFESAIIVTIISILCGLLISVITLYTAKTSKSFSITLCLLPVLVQIVIIMVNGNLGTGVAVAGAFSLIRFRSMPGKASDIILIFFAMSIGLITGMGYIYFALFVTVLISLLYLLLSKSKFGNTSENHRKIKIIIPEDLDYTEIFDDIFEDYTIHYQLCEVKTTNLGSMYQLIYETQLKNINEEKKMIDELRCRNGNLTITSSRYCNYASDL